MRQIRITPSGDHQDKYYHLSVEGWPAGKYQILTRGEARRIKEAINLLNYMEILSVPVVVNFDEPALDAE